MFPSLKWYQDLKNIYITITESDLKELKYNFESEKFTLTAEKKGNNYELNLDFFHSIDSENSLLKQTDKEIKMIIVKKEPRWWSFLIKEKKANYIYVDWDGWKDEFDSDDELYNYELPENFESMLNEVNQNMTKESN